MLYGLAVCISASSQFRWWTLDRQLHVTNFRPIAVTLANNLMAHTSQFMSQMPKFEVKTKVSYVHILNNMHP